MFVILCSIGLFAIWDPQTLFEENIFDTQGEDSFYFFNKPK